jgi:periplasmic protein TonB
LLAAQNPLDRVFELESGRMRTGFIIGICGALIVHVAAATEAARIAAGMGTWALDLRTDVHAYLAKLYEVDLVDPPPPPPPPPPPEPEPEKEAPKPLPSTHATTQQDEPPPPPAQAGKILTQEPDPNEPVDLTGQGFVTGNAETYAGGVTASNGTSTSAVRNRNAAPGGVTGGTGKKPGPTELPSGPDLSRRPSLAGRDEWDCPFPPEADAEQIDFQRVPITVTLGPDGSVKDVKVTADPGSGFGRAARQCAFRQRLNPATDRSGNPIASSMSISITFKR